MPVRELNLPSSKEGVLAPNNREHQEATSSEINCVVAAPVADYHPWRDQVPAVGKPGSVA
jgi:hypothetical protein